VSKVYYPPANHTAQWWEDKFERGDFDRADKLLLHTTEGGNWPAYDGGAKAPTLTYKPKTREWRQHNSIMSSARALRDPSSTPVRENRDNVVQVEIIGSCSRAVANRYGLQYVRDLPGTALEDLGALAAWLHLNHGLPLVMHPLWPAYPASGRSDSPARMSSAEFDRFRGLCGHMHASGNDHGDPGELDVATILAEAKERAYPEARVQNLTIATRAIAHAAAGNRFGDGDSYLADAKSFLAWASHPRVRAITDWREAEWNRHYNEFPLNRELFMGAVNGVQRHFGLPVGPLTTATVLEMKGFGYKVISYDGKAL
jgi:hypothetical protein